MAIDIRATVTCSLGTLISASINDDYVQGTGLIKCKGSCELSGIVTPAVGTAVTFSYTKNGITRKIPRKLRVLSSFADPFRRTTKVELGCKLTYLSDLQEPIDWTPFDDILNNTFTVDDAKIITIPIHASSVMDKCLDELGITATSNPLTSKFSIARFDFGPGYVQVLSDLLVSESYCGYLNRDEELVVFSLDQKGGTGPVISTNEIIELGSIGVGQLPGEAVVVSYSTLMLQAPDAGSQGTVNWEEQEDVQVLQPLVVAYGENQTRSFTGRQVTTILTEYETISLATAVSTGSWFYWQSLDQYRDVVTTRTTTVTSPSAYVEDKRVSELLTNGIAYANTDIVSTKTVETTEYARTTAEPLRKETLVYQDRRMAYSSLGLQLVYSASDYVNPSGLILVGKTVEEYEKSGSFTKTVRNEYVWAPTKQAGSQGVAQARESFADATEVAAYLGSIEGVLVHNGSSVSTTEQGVTTYQGRPAASERTNAAYASGDPNNGWRTVSTAQLELAVGSATAQRRIELSLPYPADDTFTKVGSPPTYGYTVSDVKEKATRYGRSQNRLLLGNRSGMNLQLAPEKLPAAPFAPFVVQANGVSGLYRTNGTSWQLSADGALVSVDALFWGAAGGTGDFFFPVAPGITTLPTTPAVTDTSPTTVLGTVADVGANPQTTLTAAFPSATSGQGAQDLATDEFWTYNGSTWTNVGTAPGPTSTVSTVVPVWNETVVAIARTSTKLVVTSLAYPLTLLTEAAVTTKTKLVANKITKVDVPLSTLAVAAPTPTVALGAAVQVPSTSVALAALAPVVSVSTVVAVPLTSIAVAALAPTQAGADDTVISVPLTSIAITAQVPEGVGANLESFYNSYRLQVFGWEDWIYPDWWAD